VEYQRLLLDNLDLIKQIVRTVGKRRHLSTVEREDFASFVNVRLVEEDYAILRKFQGRSTLWTYLAAVIERLSLDFCTDKWGRWRPSAMAEKLGPVAVQLERLVNRDGHPLDEAIEILRSHNDVTMNEGELRRIWEQLPVRTRTTEVGEEAADELIGSENAEDRVEEEESRKNIERLQRVLHDAFAAITTQDRVVIALRFDQDLSIVQISQLTGVSVPTLHRRLDKSVKQLRLALSKAGIDPREFGGLIGHPSLGLSPMLRAEVERFLGPVRLSKRDG
jgi:RNA polymerase sigma factor for flagellar operon FliA